MENYIRFQTRLRERGTPEALGVFRAAGVVRQWPQVPDYARKTLDESLDWFNDNLAVPRLDAADRHAIFWFRSRSATLVRHVWEVVTILREENVFVKLLTTARPGRIVYADIHQIAAIFGRR